MNFLEEIQNNSSYSLESIETPELISNANNMVRNIVKSLNILDNDDVARFGESGFSKLNRLSDEILSKVTSSDTESKRDSIIENLETILRQVDMKELIESDKRINTQNNGWMSGLVSKFSMRKEKLMNRFISVKSNIDKMEKEIENGKQIMKAQLDMFDDYIQVIDETYQELKDYRYAAEILKRKTEEKINELTEGQNSLVEIKMNQFLDIIKSKTYDLDSSIMIVIQKVPQISLMKQNCLLLLNKINTVQTVTIPLFKSAILDAINRNSQVSEMKKLDKIEDFNNRMLVYNVKENVKQTVEMRKFVSNPSLRYDTIKEIMDVLIDSIDEIKQIDLSSTQKIEENYRKINELVNSNAYRLNNKSNEIREAGVISDSNTLRFNI